MANEELIAYIKRRSAEGSSEGLIRAELMANGGWDATDLDEAYAAIDPNSMKTAIAPEPIVVEEGTGRGVRWAIAIALVALAASAYFYFFHGRPDLANINAVVNDRATTTVPVDTTGWKAFGSDRYDFSFKVPPHWTRLEVVEVPNEQYLASVFELRLDGKPVCSISAYDDAGWKRREAEAGEGMPAPFHRNETHVFTWSCVEDDYGFSDFKRYNRARDEKKTSSIESGFIKGPVQEFKTLVMPTFEHGHGGKPELDVYHPPVDTSVAEPPSEAVPVDATIRVHTQDDYGFSLTLPPGWTFAPTKSSVPGAVAAYRYSSADGKHWFTLDIAAGADPEKMTLADWAKKDALSYDAAAREEGATELGSFMGIAYAGERGGMPYRRTYAIRGVQQNIFRFAVDTDRSAAWMSDYMNTLSTFQVFEPKRSGTKAYKNVQFSFEMTLPVTWRARDDSDGTMLRNYYNPVLDAPLDPIEMQVTYMSNENPEQLPLSEWLKQGSNSIFVTGETSRRLVSIGDEAIRSVRDPYVPQPGKTLVSYLIRRGKNIVQVTYTRDAAVKYRHEPDDVVATLKFSAFDQAAYSTLIESERAKVIGEDSDRDGIWDHVQKWIEANHAGIPNIRRSLRLMAAEYQFEILNHRDKDAIVKHAHETHGYSCLSKAAPDSYRKIKGEFAAQMLNTEERLKAYYAADAQLSGQVFGVPTDDEVAAYCGF